MGAIPVSTLHTKVQMDAIQPSSPGQTVEWTTTSPWTTGHGLALDWGIAAREEAPLPLGAFSGTGLRTVRADAMWTGWFGIVWAGVSPRSPGAPDLGGAGRRPRQIRREMCTHNRFTDRPAETTGPPYPQAFTRT